MILSYAQAEPWTVVATGVADAWQNTFLFDETVLLATGAGAASSSASASLCMAQAEAYTWACPTGFDAPALGEGSLSEGIECALEGRTRLLRLARPADANYYYGVVTPTTAAWAQAAPAMCVAPDADLTRFRIDCGLSRLDRRRLDALDAAGREPPFSTINKWAARLAWLAYFQKTFYWYGGQYTGFNPYQDSANTTTTTTLCVQHAGGGGGLNTFRYATTDHADELGGPPLGGPLPAGGISACMPCDTGSQNFGEAICQLFAPPRYFSAELCARGTTNEQAELTAGTVCTECRPTIADGTATLLPIGSAAAKLWWRVRIDGLDQFRHTEDGIYLWNKIRCRYGCANGTTSNNDSPDAYRQQPCVSCAAVLARTTVCPSGAGAAAALSAFLDAPTGEATCGTVAPGETDNLRPFKAECVACASRLQAWTTPADAAQRVPRYVFPAIMTRPALSSGACLALCNPALYHSYDGHGTTPITDAVPFARLRCGACIDRADIPCLGGCVDGLYLNASAATAKCLPCTTALCPPGLYREPCLHGGASRDAKCVECPSPSEALRNAPAASISSSIIGGDAPQLLRVAMERAATAFTFNRRWLTREELAGAPLAPIVLAVDSPHPEQCALACINNFAWCVY